MARLIYAFEDVPETDLPRPPLAALRGLRTAGISLTRAGWLAMPLEARRDLVVAGARDTVIRAEVQRGVERAPIREMKLVPRIDDPSFDEIPALVAGAFGPSRQLTLEFWRSLRPLDCHVLAMFVNNTRLLWRGLAEIALRSKHGVNMLPARGWTGTLARCEVKTNPEIVLALGSPRFLDGRACILARVAGIRAARWASEILDFHVSAATGPVEVGFSVDTALRPGQVIWQAHVSTIEGQFSPSASLLAAVTAATALHDIITRAGSYVSIENARLVDEPWLHNDSEDEVTVGALNEPGSDKQRVGSVEYARVGNEYFERRGLKRYARVWSLWALGVGAVISGDFFGWNFGLASGGFGGLLLATAIITVMYIGLCLCIAEMSPALPHTGGAYSFARSAIGPWGGYITGLAENMEYILTPAVIVVGIGGYLGAIFGTPESFAPIWWLFAYLIFVGLNVWGVELSFRVTVLITFLALAILAVFWAFAIPKLDFGKFAFDVVPDPGKSVWFPKGALGVLASLPFAIWFYLGIEELPLAAEESHDPKRDMPRGILLGLLTLIVCAFATLVTSAAISPGAALLGKSNEPLFLGFQTLFGVGAGSKLLALIAVAGFIASFHTIIFAYGRQIYSLSRAGYFPRWLSLTHSTRRTPHVALGIGAALGYGVAYAIHRAGSTHPVGAVLLNMAVFGAVISYALQMLSFVLLRIRMPNIERPFRSPLGIAGALGAMAIALVSLVSLFVADPIYQKVVIGAAIWFALGLAYFAFYGRRHLVVAPEEEFAMRGKKGSS